jgi:D-alanyl-D-alanine carboxypeptidase
MRVMRYRLALGTAALVLSAAVVAPAPVAAAPGSRPGDGPPAAALQAALDAVTAAGMPGIFAEVRAGDRVWRGASGVADVRTGRPVRPHFQHRVGSITKSFVGVTLLQLVGESRLRLDDPVARHLPDLAVDGVTVRMLLNHTSGIGNYTGALLTDHDDLERLRRTTYTPRQLARIGLALPRTGPPGGDWSYSNTNYILAGLILEKVTGRSVAWEVNRRIIVPLGLRGTYFPGRTTRVIGPHSRAYLPWPDGTLRDFSVTSMTWAWAAGELVSTPADLNRFYRALFTGELLRPAEQAELLATVPMLPDLPEAAGYGLGVYRLPLPCGQGWGHDGAVIGQGTFSLHSPDGRRQVTLAMNMTSYQDSAEEPHPIDLAWNRFALLALCPGGGQAGVTDADGLDATGAGHPGSITTVTAPFTPLRTLIDAPAGPADRSPR